MSTCFPDEKVFQAFSWRAIPQSYPQQKPHIYLTNLIKRTLTATAGSVYACPFGYCHSERDVLTSMVSLFLADPRFARCLPSFRCVLKVTVSVPSAVVSCLCLNDSSDQCSSSSAIRFPPVFFSYWRDIRKRGTSEGRKCKVKSNSMMEYGVGSPAPYVQLFSV